MPTNEKTPRLGLNNWVETDKPMRIDFTSDNLLLDEVLGVHLEDADLHLTEADRAVLSNPTHCMQYLGNGAASVSKTLPFAANAVIVFAEGKPLVEFDAQNAKLIYNAAVVSGLTPGGGISLYDKSLTVKQTQEGEAGPCYNLNATNTFYECIALR